MKKKYIFQIIFSLAFLGLLTKIFFSENDKIRSLNSLMSMDGFNLLLLLIILNLSVSFLFFHILKTCSQRKVDFIQISSTFLQGGIVNQIIPGSGVVYKYFKYKSEVNINIAEYSSSQLIFYIERILAYLLLSVLLGFITIVSFNANLILFIIFTIFSVGLVFFIRRKDILKFINKLIRNYEKLKEIASEYSKIKKVIKDNFIYFILIFVLFLMQAILECIIFSHVFQIYEHDIDFEISSLLWMTSSLVTILSFVNFFGFFEIVFAYSSTFFDEKFLDIMIMVFGFRVMNLLSQIVIIILFNCYKLINK
tara:strand:+ start:59 stop:985 length:927 start_codon:yes stop_codon:yes gene_type:complete